MDSTSKPKRFLTPAELKTAKHPPAGGICTTPTGPVTRFTPYPAPLPKGGKPLPPPSSNRPPKSKGAHLQRTASAYPLPNGQQRLHAARRPPPPVNVFCSAVVHGPAEANPFHTVNRVLGLRDGSAEKGSAYRCVVDDDHPPVSAPTLPQLLSGRAFSFPVALSSVNVFPGSTASRSEPPILSANTTPDLGTQSLSRLTLSHLSNFEEDEHLDMRHFKSEDDKQDGHYNHGHSFISADQLTGSPTALSSDDDEDNYAHPDSDDRNLLLRSQSLFIVPAHRADPDLDDYVAPAQSSIVDEATTDPSLYVCSANSTQTPTSRTDHRLMRAASQLVSSSGDKPKETRPRLTRIFELQRETRSDLSADQIQRLVERTAIQAKADFKKPVWPAEVVAPIPQQQSGTPPIDWTLRTGALFMSGNSFDWLRSATGNTQNKSSEDYTLAILNFTQPQLSTSLKLSLTSQSPPHTELYAKLLTKVLSQMKSPNADEQAEVSRLQAQKERWGAALRSAFSTLIHRPLGGYFYFLHDEFNILFTKTGSSSTVTPYYDARISHSTVGLRRRLTEAGVVFTSVAVDQAEAIRATGGMDAALQALAIKKTDHTPQSSVYVHGLKHCQALLTFLLAWEDPRTERRVRKSAQLVAPFPFHHAEMAWANVHAIQTIQNGQHLPSQRSMNGAPPVSNIANSYRKIINSNNNNDNNNRQQQHPPKSESRYSLEIRGWILPSQWTNLLGLLVQAQRGQLTALLPKDFTPHSPLAWLNQTMAPKEPAGGQPTPISHSLISMHDHLDQPAPATVVDQGLVTRIHCVEHKYSWEFRLWK
ncbi:hypothetical protein BJ085DRAFT_40169 [Dimargaris cristalligena]|uniref:Uncharacterized protein n=1 Tax=Dimargaris cristalligena TaxID=215637 RepID=A0A4P9ZYR5_9FUNG|nr:hypothetical protein BJ085DRAFT_40169 [Dimargaris cristalligena]|eukprot:RKP37920.1 hypothetical protein BJ085DRAFT_40169 [Dimargaris cristalligena]